MILLLGKSDLAHAIQRQLSNPVVIVGRPEYNLLEQSSCDQLVSAYNPTVVVNTAAANEHQDPWTVLTTNFVSVAYLTLAFYNKMQQGQIINISSTSTYWVSYPGISSGRLCYNLSKESLSQFGRHFNRKIVDDNKSVMVSTVELGSFPSRFNGHKGNMTIEKAASVVCECICNPRTAVSIIK
jgi:NAD(P)-dependent dehydrogenase (short-subunit alcohol dehydrogenase family)